jgi:hypothetical protein
MSLLQININDKLKAAIHKKAKQYDVPASTLVKIVLTENFLQKPTAGNVFNTERDNKGKGVDIDSFLNLL